MDSRTRFIVASHHLRDVIWAKQENSDEWIYIGSNFPLDRLAPHIDQIFDDPEFIVIDGRNTTDNFSREDLPIVLRDRLGDTTLTICDRDMNKFMQFNKIGVIRYGTKKG